MNWPCQRLTSQDPAGERSPRQDDRTDAVVSIGTAPTGGACLRRDAVSTSAAQRDPMYLAALGDHPRGQFAGPHTRSRIIPATLAGKRSGFDPGCFASHVLAVPYGKKKAPRRRWATRGRITWKDWWECIRWVRRRRSRSQDRGRRRRAGRRAGRWAGPCRCRRP